MPGGIERLNLIAGATTWNQYSARNRRSLQERFQSGWNTAEVPWCFASGIPDGPEIRLIIIGRIFIGRLNLDEAILKGNEMTLNKGIDERFSSTN